jgi:hypothetical protein
VQLLVLVGDRLVAGREVDDAQPGMAQADTPMRRDPAPVSVGSAMEEAPRRAQQSLLGERLALGEHRHDAAHRVLPGGHRRVSPCA